jgi:hypothetical protein
MAPKFGYRVRTTACLGVAALLLWITCNSADAIPEWLAYGGVVGTALCIAGAVRFLQLERYYEGPRTRLVVDPISGTSANRRARR